MIGRIVAALSERIAEFWELADPDERIEGSGEPHVDPANEGQYVIERRRQTLETIQDEAAVRTHPADDPDR